MPPKIQNLDKHNIAKRKAEVDVAVAAAIASAKVKSDKEIAVFAARCAEIAAERDALVKELAKSKVYIYIYIYIFIYSEPYMFLHTSELLLMYTPWKVFYTLRLGDLLINHLLFRIIFRGI